MIEENRKELKLQCICGWEWLLMPIPKHTRVRLSVRRLICWKPCLRGSSPRRSTAGGAGGLAEGRCSWFRRRSWPTPLTSRWAGSWVAMASWTLQGKLFWILLDSASILISFEKYERTVRLYSDSVWKLELILEYLVSLCHWMSDWLQHSQRSSSCLGWLG